MSRVCEEHGKEPVSRCSWCAQPICESCVEEAQGYKLCDRCASKLVKDKPVFRSHRRKGSGPVRNVDESLSKDKLAAARRRYAHEEEQQEVPRWRQQ